MFNTMKYHATDQLASIKSNKISCVDNNDHSSSVPSDDNVSDNDRQKSSKCSLADVMIDGRPKSWPLLLHSGASGRNFGIYCTSECN